MISNPIKYDNPKDINDSSTFSRMIDQELKEKMGSKELKMHEGYQHLSMKELMKLVDADIEKSNQVKRNFFKEAGCLSQFPS